MKLWAFSLFFNDHFSSIHIFSITTSSLNDMVFLPLRTSFFLTVTKCSASLLCCLSNTNEMFFQIYKWTSEPLYKLFYEQN